MVRRRPAPLFCALMLSACAGDSFAPYDGPPFCEQIVRWSIPQNLKRSVDILFVVDNSAAMATLHPSVAERMGQLLKPFRDLADKGTLDDLHVGVLTTDSATLVARGKEAPTDCQPPVGANWVHYDFFHDHPESDNLPPGQSLDRTLGCMAAVGSDGRASLQPLESAYQALHGVLNPGFLRRDALLVLVFITAGDDASPSPVKLYADWLTLPRIQGGLKDSPLDVVAVAVRGPAKRPAPASPSCEVGAFSAVPAPRLDAALESARQHEEVSICEPDWTSVLDIGAKLIVGNISFGCIRWRFADPAHPVCRAVDLTRNDDGSETRTVLPYCGDGVPLPCWMVEEKEVCGRSEPDPNKRISPQGLGFTFRRDWRGAPPHTSTEIECAVPCP